MPFKVHEDAMKKSITVNIMRPPELAPEKIPEGWSGTANRGLPIVEIPHYHFPCVVYMHPNESTRRIEHRNAQHEIVDIELVQAEHLSKLVGCDDHKDGGPKECKDCTALLEAALAEGWQTTPFIAPPLPNPDAGLYGPRKKTEKEKKEHG